MEPEPIIVSVAVMKRNNCFVVISPITAVYQLQSKVALAVRQHCLV